MANYDRMVRAYMKMRERRSQLKREFEETDGKIKAQMEMIETEFLKMFQETGTKNLKTEMGTVFTAETTKASIADWGTFAEWVRANNALEFLEQRVKAKEVTTYLEEHGELPPGINTHRERNVRIRKS